ncbi:CCA tRNA nucleotidyltransferase [Pontixanthobacter gangjinensis]|uniref:CCA tRNA nucleotidyltransferase n=1 Tax=Pontixanthobacter gangjinensis TaxID=1028742 RepID=A0A6I4SMZ8_9SPHN|nr:CCA tRNA nucleotidyltransferase [Pontixanthobacter gangjinensis]MXO56516.1 CCA tRNA nucleotidyltransferase [Pontixanthobacter gangjinensis]
MADLLPAAPWTQRPDLAELVAAIGAENMRWVGGAVRDTVLGLDVADIDAATVLQPQEIIKALEAANIRSVPTGIEHGTITALLSGGPVEITTLRRDVSTDGRRATIAFTDDWRDDAARRDFTINALYAHPETGDISDYFGGLEDLSNRHVRFIGDAYERIREDHLRILRYFRFQARFGSELDQQAVNACSELAETIKGLSRERVAKELLLLLSLPAPEQTVELMAKLGVWKVILPETQARQRASLQELIECERAASIEPDPMRRLSALLPALPAIANDVGTRLRLSRAQRARLTCNAERSVQDALVPRTLVYNVGMECAIDRLLIAGADIGSLHNWVIPTLPLKGGEIVARGVDAGPEVARILRAVEARWVEEGFPERSRVEEILEDELAQRNSPDA